MRTVFKLVVGTLFLFLAAPVASAYAQGPLVASEPRPKQELSREPGWVTLAFGHELDNGVAKLVVTNSKGEPVAKDAPIIEGTNITMQLEDGLAKDTYTVHYRVNGSDGDIVGGAFQFAYGKGKWTTIKDASWDGAEEQPTILAETDPWGNPTPEDSESPLPDVVVEQSDGPDISVSPPATVEPSPEAAAVDEEDSASAGMSPVVIGSIGAAVVVLVGVLAAIWWRRRRS